MSIISMGKAIKEAREAAGMTQEQLASGICDVTTVGRVEIGSMGAGPALFQALMTKAGRTVNCIPIFVDRNDFDCYLHLKYARRYFELMKFEEAYRELKIVEVDRWANNVLYFQEWIVVYSKIGRYSDSADVNSVLKDLLFALNFTHPQLNINNIVNDYFTINEIELLCEISNCLFLLCDKKGKAIAEQLHQYMMNRGILLQEKRYGLESRILTIKWLMYDGEFSDAEKNIEVAKADATIEGNSRLIIDIEFLFSICTYRLGKIAESKKHAKIAFYFACALSECFAKMIYSQFIELNVVVPEIIGEKAQKIFDKIELAPISRVGLIFDVQRNIVSKEIFHVGRIIHELRSEQQISLSELSRGLCSKSCLSKIENNKMIPDLFLLEALFQRLGLATEDFTFYGCRREDELYAIRDNLGIAHRNNKSENELNEIYRLQHKLSHRDKYIRQYYEYKIATKIEDKEAQIIKLKEALQLTNDDNLVKNHFTWTELTILNNIGYCLCRERQYQEAIGYFRKVIDYFLKERNYAPSLQSGVFSVAMADIAECFFAEQDYTAMERIDQVRLQSQVGINGLVIGAYLANQCRSYFYIGNRITAHEYAYQSYYSFLAFENVSMADKIHSIMKTKFDMDID